jgi:hypothetical protein
MRPIATVILSRNGQKTPSARCYCKYEAFVSLRILESKVSRVIFLKKLPQQKFEETGHKG